MAMQHWEESDGSGILVLEFILPTGLGVWLHVSGDSGSSKAQSQRRVTFVLACNPLQCPCLENPRDQGAWWAAIYGVAQSRTRLK